ncbi:MAG: TlpA family protein disulfide reductase [Bacteroidia bacterium]|nr:TlpA family protein disulfide reductase [Bacteroidia bacterium]
MKKIIILISLILIGGTAGAQFKLSGKIRSLRPVVLSVTDLNGTRILEESISSGVEFSTGEVTLNRDLYLLEIGELKRYVILENQPVHVRGFLDDRKPENTNLVYDGLDLNNQFETASNQFLKSSKGPYNWDSVNDLYDPIVLSSVIYIYKNFFETKTEIVGGVFEKLNDYDTTSLVIKYLMTMKSKMDNYSEGASLVDFNLPDRNGHNYSTASFKGKFILLDFWASWCGPCRAEMKSLHKIYEELKGDDLVFISISLDDNRSDWIKALDADNIPWLALWDEDGFDNSKLREQFGFSQIPFIVLIGKDGKLAARNLRGEDVKNKIIELRNNTK